MRPVPDPLEPGPDERFADALDAFGLEETVLCQALRVHPAVRAGLAAGRLRRASGRGVRLVHRRLAYRHPVGRQRVVLRQANGRTVRLPFA